MIVDHFTRIVVAEQPVLVAVGTFAGSVHFNGCARGRSFVSQGLSGCDEMIHPLLGCHQLIPETHGGNSLR